MKANRGRCNFLSSLDISAKFLLPAGILGNQGSQKPLGVTTDGELNFREHVNISL